MNLAEQKTGVFNGDLPNNKQNTKKAAVNRASVRAERDILHEDGACIQNGITQGKRGPLLVFRGRKRTPKEEGDWEWGP